MLDNIKKTTSKPLSIIANDPLPGVLSLSQLCALEPYF